MKWVEFLLASSNSPLNAIVYCFSALFYNLQQKISATAVVNELQPYPKTTS